MISWMLFKVIFFPVYLFSCCCCRGPSGPAYATYIPPPPPVFHVSLSIFNNSLNRILGEMDLQCMSKVEDKVIKKQLVIIIILIIMIIQVVIIMILILLLLMLLLHVVKIYCIVFSVING